MSVLPAIHLLLVAGSFSGAVLPSTRTQEHTHTQRNVHANVAPTHPSATSPLKSARYLLQAQFALEPWFNAWAVPATIFASGYVACRIEQRAHLPE